MQIRPVSNGSKADVSESTVDTGNTCDLTTTTNGELDAFDSDEDYYWEKLEFCLCKTENKNKKFRKQK